MFTAYSRFVYHAFVTGSSLALARRLSTACVVCTIESVAMAARQCLTSDHDFLLRYIDELPDDADSDFEFEGYLDEDKGPVACTSQDDELQRSPSLDRHIITPSMSSLSGRRRIYALIRATFYSERLGFFLLRILTC